MDFLIGVDGLGQMAWVAASMQEALLGTILFGVVGIVLSLAGFKLFDWVMPICFNKELEKGNIAVGILCGAIVVGICTVIASAVS